MGGRGRGGGRGGGRGRPLRGLLPGDDVGQLDEGVRVDVVILSEGIDGRLISKRVPNVRMVSVRGACLVFRSPM